MGVLHQETSTALQAAAQEKTYGIDHVFLKFPQAKLLQFIRAKSFARRALDHYEKSLITGEPSDSSKKRFR